MALNSTNRPKSLINHVICPIGLHELHLWEINLNSSSNEDAGLIELLTEDERRRASAFKSTVARKEFVVTRGVLRLLLEQYTGVSARQLSFRYGPYGKPLLINSNAPGINFNVSHSDGMALLAFTAGCDVGIDIQKVIAPEQMAAIRLILTDAERAELDAADTSHALGYLSSRIWVAKEALLKSLGFGLGHSSHVTVSNFLSREPTITVSPLLDPAPLNRHIRWLDSIPEYVAAFACPANISCIRRFTWNCKDGHIF